MARAGAGTCRSSNADLASPAPCKKSAQTNVTPRGAGSSWGYQDVLHEDDGSIDTMSIEVHDGRITAIYVVRNPEKLQHVRC
jgi:hypothetical protein